MADREAIAAATRSATHSGAKAAITVGNANVADHK